MIIIPYFNRVIQSAKMKLLTMFSYTKMRISQPLSVMEDTFFQVLLLPTLFVLM